MKFLFFPYSQRGLCKDFPARHSLWHPPMTFTLLLTRGLGWTLSSLIFRKLSIRHPTGCSISVTKILNLICYRGWEVFFNNRSEFGAVSGNNSPFGCRPIGSPPGLCPGTSSVSTFYLWLTPHISPSISMFSNDCVIFRVIIHRCRRLNSSIWH